MRWFEINAPCVESYADISYSHHIIIILFGKLGIDTIDVTWNIHFMASLVYLVMQEKMRLSENIYLYSHIEEADIADHITTNIPFTCSHIRLPGLLVPLVSISSPKPISKGWNSCRRRINCKVRRGKWSEEWNNLKITVSVPYYFLYLYAFSIDPYKGEGFIGRRVHPAQRSVSWV